MHREKPETVYRSFLFWDCFQKSIMLCFHFHCFNDSLWEVKKECKRKFYIILIRGVVKLSLEKNCYSSHFKWKWKRMSSYSKWGFLSELLAPNRHFNTFPFFFLFIVFLRLFNVMRRLENSIDYSSRCYLLRKGNERQQETTRELQLAISLSIMENNSLTKKDRWSYRKLNFTLFAFADYWLMLFVRS